jgi:hypothetical protein
MLIVWALALTNVAAAAPLAHTAKPPGTATATKAPAVHAPTSATAAPTVTAPPPAPRASESATAPDTGGDTPTLKAGQDGTVFRSLTVEGEDRVHFDFERPPLTLDLDPMKAPGLDWGSARDVLDRTVPDLGLPLLTESAASASPYTGRPWLSHFSSGAVARFKPDVKGVDTWTLAVVNARGETVATYQGKGEPPHEITWDGRAQGGAPVVPGLAYSYVLTARDRAGNKRNFVGQAFRVSAYRLDGPSGPTMVFSGRELPAADPRRPVTAARLGETATPPILLEAASWLNQSARSAQPVRITATARTFEEAQALSQTVTSQLAPLVLKGAARLQATTDVQPDAPEGGAVKISGAR